MELVTALVELDLGEYRTGLPNQATQCEEFWHALNTDASYPYRTMQEAATSEIYLDRVSVPLEITERDITTYQLYHRLLVVPNNILAGCIKIKKKAQY